MSKTLTNVSIEDAQAAIPDIIVVGNGDMWQLLSKASSSSEGWMKSSKAMQIDGVGCCVQVTTQQGEHVTEAVTFVPNVIIMDDINGGRKLVQASNAEGFRLNFAE